MVMSTALLCLSLNVYFEARGESTVGQRAVAAVTWNRAGYKSENVCKVVLAKKQFSWTNDKIKKVAGGHRLKKGFAPKEKEAWDAAVFAAKFTMKYGNVFDVTGGATHYHTKKVFPIWRHSLTKVTVIGNHIFYRHS